MKSDLSSGASTSSQPAPLAAYLTGVVGGTLLLAVPQAEAAVTSVTFGFGSVLDVTDGSSYTTPTTPNFGTIPRAVSYRPGNSEDPPESSFRIGEIFSQYGHFYQQGSGNYSGLGIGLPTFLENGTVLGAGGNGVLGMAYFSSNNSERDLPTDQLDQNLGFVTSTGHWGWANVSWDATAKALTFNSAYVESVAGNTITVGDTGISAAPEPSRALLALAGLAGVALRRRRKQAA